MTRLIEQNIEAYGFHIYLVQEDVVPRFAYTIGLHKTLGAELVVAGAIYYMADDINRVMHMIREQVMAGREFETGFMLGELGSFTLRKAHPSWTRSLLLGALDYYKPEEICAYQIVPDAKHWTIDTPDMAKEWSATTEPVWQWLHEEWKFSVPETSTAMTDLDALRGARIIRAARWGEDDWEIFARPAGTTTEEEARVVPLGCLLAADPSLAPVMSLEVGKGLWRDSEAGAWIPWGTDDDSDS